MEWELPRAPNSVLVMLDAATEQGVDARACLHGTGLRLDPLHAPNATVTPRQEFAVARNLLRALGYPPGFGLTVGLRYRMATYGIWGFALFSSPNLRAAIEIGLRFFDLTYSFCRMHTSEDADEYRLHIEAPSVPPDMRQFFIERDAGAVQSLQQELFGSAVPVRRIVTNLVPPSPEGTAALEQIFGLTVEFGADDTAIVFDKAVLDIPLPQADAQTTALLQEQCRILLDQRTARSGRAGEIRALLVTSFPYPLSARQAATALHVSERALRNQLGAEGTSYRALLDEVRERLADELLLAGGLTAEEVAVRLGYADVSSFNHAFHRWKGMGPRAYRRASTSSARPG